MEYDPAACADATVTFRALTNAGGLGTEMDTPEQSILHALVRGGRLGRVLGVISYAKEDGTAREITNRPDHEGSTPLHWAALLVPAKMAVSMARALLDGGADPNARDRGGATPLHRAALRPDNAVLVCLLLQKGADPNARDADDDTPLHWACTSGEADAEALKALVKKGADPDARNKAGKTARQGAWKPAHKQALQEASLKSKSG